MLLGLKEWGVLAAGVSSLALAGATAQAAPVIASTDYVAPAAASQPVDFEVFLPLRNTAGLDTLLKQQQDPASANYHKWLTPAQFHVQFGPTDADMAQAAAALTAQGFTIVAMHTRSIEVSGTATNVASAFATNLSRVQPRNGPARLVASAKPTLPAALKAVGATIVNFSGRPPFQKHSQKVSLAVPDNRYGNTGPYWFDDLKQAYDYPSYKALDGAGVSVAILMSNDIQDSDVQQMFDHEHFTDVTGKPAPKVTHVPIDGGAPFDVNASFEASLDVQQVLGGAPGSHVSLINIPDLSDDNVIAGYLYIVESNAYDVVNSSFGECEKFYTAPYNGGQDYTGILDTYETLFKQGNSQGITFVASSGDSGGLECPDPSYFSGYANAKPKFRAGVETPAASPSVTAVGGGNLITTTPPNPQPTPPVLTSKYVQENAFGDPEVAYDPYGVGVNVSGGFWGAGGGVSVHFPKPDYQIGTWTGAGTMRTVPDVGMQVGGCPAGISKSCNGERSAAIVVDGGNNYGVIGTSVSSPEFVGAIALYLQKIGGRVGNLNYYLYSVGHQQTAGQTPASYHRNIPGFDGKYDSSFPNHGYDYLVGNGTPRVRALFGMTDLPPAGDPQTPSNP